MFAIFFMFYSVGTSPPHIIDVDWRLDYYIKVQLYIYSILIGPVEKFS